jgi:hypothetical protein
VDSMGNCLSETDSSPTSAVRWLPRGLIPDAPGSDEIVNVPLTASSPIF